MKIMVIGWFGAGNIGDEAILISELFLFRTLMKEVELYILSFDPERTEKLTSGMPEVKKILRMGSKKNVIRSDIAGIFKAFREVDVVVIGGGGLFQDIYNHYPIPFFTAMALFARLNRKRITLYCIGIGPIRTAVGRRLCRLAAHSAHLISVRDRESRDLLRDLGVTKQIHLSADPVFLLEPVWNAKVEQVIEFYELQGNRPFVGVCIQDLLFWDDANRKILAETLDNLSRNHRARIIFLPFGSYGNSWLNRRSSDSVDVIASKRIGALMNEQFSIMNIDVLSPGELLAVISRLDLIVSMRIHGLIMGLTAQVPVIALTYKEESKIRNLMVRLGRQDSLYEVRRLEKQQLLKEMEYLLSGTVDHKEELKDLVSPLRRELEKCNRMFVRFLMANHLD